jgi:hypothetical protein
MAGAKAALRRMKIAGPMGADHGVMPSGQEVSHGTDRTQYARKDQASPVDNTQGVTDHGNPSWWRDLMPEWLLDTFTSYEKSDTAPGQSDGGYGEEVIG